MDLLQPSALALLLVLIPLLVLLHLRRRPRRVERVSSLRLWPEPGPGGGPRARRRRRLDPLLPLQALVLAAVVVALARPVVGAGAGRRVVLVFDCSASMTAVEEGGTRFDLARRRALDALDSLGRRDRVRIVEARARPRAAGGFLLDRRELRRRILALEPGEAPADLDAALLLALSAAGDDGEVWVFGDGDGGSVVPPALRTARVRFVRVGETADNLGITRLVARPSRLSPFDHDLLVEVTNSSPRRREVPLAIVAGPSEAAAEPRGRQATAGGGAGGAARERTLAIDPGRGRQVAGGGTGDGAARERGPALDPGGDRPVAAERTAGGAIWEGTLALDPGERRQVVVEGALGPGEVATAILGTADAMAVDDRARVLVPPRAVTRVLLLTGGNRFLETALGIDPAIDLSVAGPRAARAARADEDWDVVVFDGVEPGPPGAPRSLVIRHPGRSAEAAGAGGADGRLEPAAGAGGHPVMAGVDLDGVTAGALAPLDVAPGGTALAESGGEPVLVAFERDGRRRVTVGFDLRESTWPLDVSFPVFTANALRWLAPERDAAAVDLAAGEPFVWTLPSAGPSEVTIEDPHGTRRTVPVTGGRAVFEDTERTGIYTLRDGGGGEVRFAINLLSAAESDLRPAGGDAGGRSAPRTAGAVAARSLERPEIGRAVLLAALALLLMEWAWHCRRIARRPTAGAVDRDGADRRRAAGAG